MCWTMASYISFRYQYLFPFVNTYKTLPAPTKTPGMMRALRKKWNDLLLLDSEVNVEAELAKMVMM